MPTACLAESQLQIYVRYCAGDRNIVSSEEMRPIINHILNCTKCDFRAHEIKAQFDTRKARDRKKWKKMRFMDLYTRGQFMQVLGGDMDEGQDVKVSDPKRALPEAEGYYPDDRDQT